jgi:hypothetical protein
MYIGVDPGKITGVAYYAPYYKKLPELNHLVGPPMDICQDIHHLITATQNYPDLVDRIILAVERYTMGNSTRTQQPDALKIIGVMEWFAHIYPNVTLVMQGAADAAKPGSRENLTKVGWWIKADPDQHRNKAAAQVALAILTHDPEMWYALITGATIKT